LVLTERGGIAVAHKAFLEVKQEQLAFEHQLLTSRGYTEKNTLVGGLNGWRGVLIGTGLGMALAIGGMHLISGTTSVPAAKSQTRHSKTSLKQRA